MKWILTHTLTPALWLSTALFLPVLACHLKGVSVHEDKAANPNDARPLGSFVYTGELFMGLEGGVSLVAYS